ncbi:MAG: VOC family protein [Chryseolinea sp.]
MPLNNPQIIPMLAYENGVEAMAWLCKAFGFTEKAKMLDEKGKLMHGEIELGGGIVMLASPTEDYQSPNRHRQVCETAAKWYQSPYIINGVLVYVDDVEKHYQQAKEQGAVFLSGIETGGPGPRYRVEDLEGQRWMFIQRR